jgi:chromosome segregation ATPase
MKEAAPMARTGVTREQVFEAAARLKARGASITNQRVRDELGETGSYTTISRYLDEWRAADAAKDHETLPEIPEAAEQAMLGAIREVWRVAAAGAQREITDVKEAAERRIQEIQNQHGEAHAEVARLEKDAAAADDEIQTLKIRSGQLDKDLAAARAVEAELRERVAAEETRCRELEAKVGELGAAEAELQRRLAAEVTRRGELEVQVRELDTKARDLAGGLEDAKRQIKDAEAGRTAATAAAVAATEENNALKGKAGDLEKRLGAAVAVEAELRERVKAEEVRNQAMESRMSELNKELVRLAAAKESPAGSNKNT